MDLASESREELRNNRTKIGSSILRFFPNRQKELLTMRPTGKFGILFLFGAFLFWGMVSTGLSARCLTRIDFYPKAKPGVFLVADEALLDPNFQKTVVLIVRQDEMGTLGVIINRPTDIPLSDVFPDIGELKNLDYPLFIGGPVGFNLFSMLVRTKNGKDVEEAESVFENVFFSMDMATLNSLLRQKAGDYSLRGFAGHSGWAPGQLENELDRGDWMVVKADPLTVFEKKSELIWGQLVAKKSQKWVFSPLFPSRNSAGSIGPFYGSELLSGRPSRWEPAVDRPS